MVADKLAVVFSVLVGLESGSASGSRIPSLGSNDEGKSSNICIRPRSVYRTKGVKRLVPGQLRAAALRRQTQFQAVPVRTVRTFS